MWKKKKNHANSSIGVTQEEERRRNPPKKTSSTETVEKKKAFLCTFEGKREQETNPTTTENRIAMHSTSVTELQGQVQSGATYRKKKMREKAGKRKRDNTYTIEIKRAPLPKKKKKECQEANQIRSAENKSRSDERQKSDSEPGCCC